MSNNKIPTKPNKRVLNVIINYLNYNEKTGVIIFSQDYRYRKKGSIADIKRNTANQDSNYLCVSFNTNDKTVLVSSHHIAWFLKTGEWPDNLIDHKDGNGLNNKWKNLRLGDSIKNAINRKIQTPNTSGVKGVYLKRTTNKYGKTYDYWTAVITVNKKRIHLGQFKIFEDAVKARTEAEHKYFKEWSVLNR